MRRTAAVFVAALLSAAPAAMAAPTCWDAQGQTVRCGTPGALPVGARLSAAQETLRRERPAGASAAALAGLAVVLGGLFALLALMPDFERFER